MNNPKVYGRLDTEISGPKKPGEVEYTNLELSRLWRKFVPSMTTLRRMIGVATVAVVFWVCLSWYSSQTQINDITQARSEGRVSTCASDQRFELAHNKLTQSVQDTFNKLLGDTAASRPAQRDLILQYAKGLSDQLELAKVRVRSCTDQGIRDFYKQKFVPVACPNVTEQNGLCVTTPTLPTTGGK